MIEQNLEQQHSRTAETFGDQSAEERISQIPQFSQQMLEDIQAIASNFDDYTGPRRAVQEILSTLSEVFEKLPELCYFKLMKLIINLNQNFHWLAVKQWKR